MKLTDIIKFNDKAQVDAARWCFKHGITGKVILIDSNCLTIETALNYPIWVHITHVDIIAKQSDAPIPDDLGVRMV